MKKADYLAELQDVIVRLHGVRATHIESVPVKEEFRGETVWEGIVEVFKLYSHPKANWVYAWATDADDPQKPRRHVTLLHIPPVTSAAQAVKAAILQESKRSKAGL